MPCGRLLTTEINFHNGAIMDGWPNYIEKHEIPTWPHRKTIRSRQGAKPLSVALDENGRAYLFVLACELNDRADLPCEIVDGESAPTSIMQFAGTLRTEGPEKAMRWIHVFIGEADAI